jgi:hypothetical protein
VVIYSLFLELNSISKLEDMAKIKVQKLFRYHVMKKCIEYVKKRVENFHITFIKIKFSEFTSHMCILYSVNLPFLIPN